MGEKNVVRDEVSPRKVLGSYSGWSGSALDGAEDSLMRKYSALNFILSNKKINIRKIPCGEDSEAWGGGMPMNWLRQHS